MDTDVFYFPPFHPNCRCTVVAIKDIKEYANGVQSGTPIISGAGVEEVINTLGNLDRILEQPSAATPHSGKRFANLQDIQDYYKEKLPNLLIGNNFSFCDNGLVTSAFEQFDTLLNKYPAIGNKLKFIIPEKPEVGSGFENTFCWTQGDKLYFNTDKWNNVKKLNDAVSNNILQGNYVGTNASPEKYIIAHEYGHLLFDTLPLEKRIKIEEYFTKLNKGSLSRVGDIDTHEMFAEAFAAYELGSNDKNLAATARSIFELIK